ncbi:MAG: hypothetical protein M5U08_14005 [Burkholderiales bacterium]|nr:hypothetical protein [Burkholderiales bacterium]
MPEQEQARRVLSANLDSLAGDDALTALTSGVPGMDAFLPAALAPAGVAIGMHPGFMRRFRSRELPRAGVPAFRLCARVFSARQAAIAAAHAPDTRDRCTRTSSRPPLRSPAAILLAACAGAALPAQLDPATIAP